MARTKTVYRCSACGAEHSKWQGRCDTCGEWNTLVEESVAPKVAVAAGGAARRIGGARAVGGGGRGAATPRPGGLKWSGGQTQKKRLGGIHLGSAPGSGA